MEIVLWSFPEETSTKACLLQTRPTENPKPTIMQLAEIQTLLGITYISMTTYWKLNLRKSSLMAPIWGVIEPPELFPANIHKLPVHHMSSPTAWQKGNAYCCSGHPQVITADESSRGQRLCRAQRPGLHKRNSWVYLGNFLPRVGMSIIQNWNLSGRGNRLFLASSLVIRDPLSSEQIDSQTPLIHPYPWKLSLLLESGKVFKLWRSKSAIDYL